MKTLDKIFIQILYVLSSFSFFLLLSLSIYLSLARSISHRYAKNNILLDLGIVNRFGFATSSYFYSCLLALNYLCFFLEIIFLAESKRLHYPSSIYFVHYRVLEIFPNAKIFDSHCWQMSIGSQICRFSEIFLNQIFFTKKL